MLKPEVIQRLADEIDLAGKNTTPIAPFTQAYPELTIEDAREIQLINIRRRMAAGARMVGKKVGATNPVMQEKFNLREPVLGYLLSNIIRNPSQPIRRDTQIAPFIECEILFVLAERLQGPNVHPVDVLRAAKGAMPAIKVPDVRFTGSQNPAVYIDAGDHFEADFGPLGKITADFI